MQEAIPVFDDPYAITVTDNVVVYTWRSANMRIISVRPAEPRECEEYEEGQ